MMSCAGNRHISTPNMDYIAQNGARFTNAYCANPVCLPSRFSMLTGFYPGQFGLNDDAFDKNKFKVPEYILSNGFGTLMKRRTYDAVYGGKVNLPSMTAADLGFDYICADERDKLARTCAEYILNHDEKPFFMVASFINPHDICLMAIADFADEDPGVKNIMDSHAFEVENVRNAARMPDRMNPEVFFNTVCPPLPVNYFPSADEPEAVCMLQEKRYFKKLVRERYTDRQWRLHRWAYAKLVESVDAQIGLIVDALIRSGQWDDTVVMFTSDHGDMDASHKMEHKENLYEECCRVPFIIKSVGGARGVTDGRLVVSGLDMICTMMDYAGIERPRYLKGESLRPFAENREGPYNRKHIVVECENGAMATDGRYKYVKYNEGERAEQFYDLSVNPYERYNELDAAPPEKLEYLKTALENHFKYE